MTFTDLVGRGASIPEHNRLRGLDHGNPHPQYALTTPTVTWVTPTLLNSWVDLGGGGAAAQYCLLNGVVHIKGRVGSGNQTTTVFTLPAGFLPAEDRRFAIAVYDGGSHYHGMLYVTSAGLVQVHCSGPVDPLDEVNIDVSFVAEQ